MCPAVRKVICPLSCETPSENFSKMTNERREIKSICSEWMAKEGHEKERGGAAKMTQSGDSLTFLFHYRKVSHVSPFSYSPQDFEVKFPRDVDRTRCLWTVLWITKWQLNPALSNQLLQNN
ncbi:hypothetical protein TNCV_1387181 [Trichonephila clavipes]|nr:hypothetical protein TNCV_1387181 [Trichonephila clavipes]